MTATDTGTGSEAAHAADAHAHPHDGHYFRVAGVLAVLTAIEVATSYIGFVTDRSWLLLAVLLPIMVVKFGTVAAFFMHLKGDSPLFSRLFAGGIAIAAAVYLIVLLAFDEFF